MNGFLIALPVFCMLASVSGANLWNSPGFEEWNAKKGLPTEFGWKLPGKGSKAFAVFERSETEKHSGRYSLHLKDTDDGKENQCFGMILAGEQARKLSGGMLRFSAWIKQVSASSPGNVGIGLYIQTKSGKTFKRTLGTGTTGQTDWIPLELKTRLPDDVSVVFALLNCATGWGGTGEAFFDDIRLTIDGGKTQKKRFRAPESRYAIESPETLAFREGYRLEKSVDRDERPRPEIRNGTWYFNGKPRFQLGVFIGNRTDINWNPRSNRLQMKHFAYTMPPSKLLCDKMGFNSVQISAAHALPAIALHGFPLPKTWKADERHIGEFFSGFRDLPLVLDFAFGYAKEFPAEKRRELDQQNGKWHEFMPLCPEHPEGDAYYRDYFLGGTRAAMRYKANVFLYELFNESSYNCQCAFNRHEFSRRMKEKYGSIERANRVWETSFDHFDELAAQTHLAQFRKLWPDWCKFSETRYAEILARGKSLVRSVDRRPHVYFTEQAAGTPSGRVGMDYRKIASVLDVLAIEGGWQYGFASDYQAKNEMEAVVATGGSKHFFNCDFYQALTKGKKPIVNNEHYCIRIEHGVRVPSRREDWITSLWLEIMHGVSGSYLFAWSNRWWEWKNFEEAKKNVLIPSYKSSHILNPYNWPVDQLDAFHAFNREFAPFQEKILPFPRTKSATVAVFFSYPTLRMSEFSSGNYMKSVTDWYAALLHAHYPVKVVFEEDLEQGLGPEVQALILPACPYSDPAMPEWIEKFRNRGGLVVAGTDSIRLDEQGNPLAVPDSFLRVSSPEELLPILAEKKIRRYGSLSPADGGGRLTCSDLQIVDRNAFKLICLVNMDDVGSRLATLRLFPEGNPQKEFYLSDAIKKITFSNGRSERWTLSELAERGVSVVLPPQERVILLLTEKRPEGNRVLSAPQDTRRIFSECMERERPRISEFRRKLREMRQREEDARLWRNVDRSKCRPLDLRKFMNMAFRDSVAGDGKGGWFDQGPNDFANMPLGKQILAGVPFEIVDPESNNGRGVLILYGNPRSSFPKSAGPVPVGLHVKALYFLHTLGWNGRDVMTYRIRYKDGSFLDVPIRENFEIGGWWGTSPLPFAKIAVEVPNAERDRVNLQCFRWENPSPEKPINSFEVISACGNAVPALVAVTAEQP